MSRSPTEGEIISPAPVELGAYTQMPQQPEEVNGNEQQERKGAWSEVCDFLKPIIPTAIVTSGIGVVTQWATQNPTITIAVSFATLGVGCCVAAKCHINARNASLLGYAGFFSIVAAGITIATLIPGSGSHPGYF